MDIEKPSATSAEHKTHRTVTFRVTRPALSDNEAVALCEVNSTQQRHRRHHVHLMFAQRLMSIAHTHTQTQTL